MFKIKKKMAFKKLHENGSVTFFIRSIFYVPGIKNFTVLTILDDHKYPNMPLPSNLI